MAMNNPYQQYQTNAVQTASPGELTLMLYNGCLKFIKLARQAIETGDVAAHREGQPVEGLIGEAADLPVNVHAVRLTGDAGLLSRGGRPGR